MAKRILLVDDSEFIIEIMAHILTDQGYEVITHNCGSEVANIVKHQQPDLLILDINLPDMDGITVCRALKAAQETSHIPIIICSGSGDMRALLKQQGAPDDILAKPFDLKNLLDKVQLQLTTDNALTNLNC